jgi:hypothetical protein
MGTFYMHRFLIVLFLAVLACSTRVSMAETQSGSLEGRITVGPLRPGPVRPDEGGQLLPAEFVSSHKIAILTEDKHKVKEVTFDSKGAYKTDLPPGKYLVALEPNDVGIRKPAPVPVTIESGKKATLNLDFDTGMR